MINTNFLVELFVNLSQLSPLFAAIVTAGIGGVVYVWGVDKKFRYVFTLFSILLTIWAVGCFFQSIVTSDESGLFWDKIIYSVAPLFPPTLVWLTSFFSKRNDRVIISLLFLTSAILFVANWTSGFRVGVVQILDVRYLTQPDMGWYLFFWIFSCAFTYSLWSLKVEVTKQKEKFRALTLLYLLPILLIAGCSYFVLIWFSLPQLLSSFLNLSSSILLSVFMLALGYSSLKRDVIEIKVEIPNIAATLIYAVLSFFIAIMLTYMLKDNVIFLILANSMYVFFAMAFSGRVIEAIKSPLEEKWLKGVFNSEKVLSDLSRKILNISNPAEMLEVVGTVFKKEMDLVNANMLIPETFFDDESEGGFFIYECGVKEKYSEQLSIKNDLLAYFVEHPHICEYKQLPSSLQHMLKENRCISLNHVDDSSRIVIEGTLFIPIFSLNNLAGMLLLGPKNNKKGFTEYDINFLQTIMHQIMVAFDKLAHQEHLGESNKKLAAANNELIEQIELKEKALAVAKDASTYETFANLTKQISHEIRNPMTGIMLTVDAFETKVERAGGNPEPKQLNTFMENIRYMSGRIFNILDTMLRYGKSKTPNKVAVNLKDVMSAVEVLMNLYAKNKSVKIQNDITELIKVKGYQTRLEQVFTNLVKNAVEAFPKGKMDGKVTVSLTPESYTFKNKHIEKGVRIDIADNGKGIEEDKLNNIFDPFITHKSGGTGLGLSVVHDIIDDHEGLITIQSEVDKGTTFSVFLPLVR